MTGKSVPFKLTDTAQKALDQMKRVIAERMMLVFPNYDSPFEVHTDASDYQFGGVISQTNRPIAFFSKKLNSEQRKYTTTDKELLSIVETLKEFKTILYGQNFTI